jgi:hypothetical protein
MELPELVAQVSGFDGVPPRETIQFFAWFLHTYGGKEAFTNADIRTCFSDLHMADPNVAKYLPRMVEYGDLIRVRGEFKLERTHRATLDAKYGIQHSVVHVSKLLSDLPGKVPDLAEKNFLAEAIKCYRSEAYRACVVMTWNLAYSHLLHWILNEPKRLDEFNAAIARRYPKKSGMRIVRYEDFNEELKESEVLEICNTASLISRNISRILKEKLGKRNAAAHPASIVIVQSQADDVVTDLVNNVVLHLS